MAGPLAGHVPGTLWTALTSPVQCRGPAPELWSRTCAARVHEGHSLVGSGACLGRRVSARPPVGG